jgi:hypothetical protein
MSTNFRTVLERWRCLADTDLLCPENPAKTDWGAVVAAIAATRATLAQPEGEGPHDLIRKLLHPAYERGDGSADGAQQVTLEWWHPIFGSDSLQVVIDNARDLLTSWGRPVALPPLPANYIDPEHQGEALELLQTFYHACQAEGGTADEIYLRAIRAVLAARPAAPATPEVWEGADHPDGPWRPISAPQTGLPWQAGGAASEGKAPATITPADRLALAVCRGACPTGGPCSVEAICSDCRRDSAAVAHELAAILRERHGGSSQVADWLDGVGCHPETVQTVQKGQ